MTRRLAFLYHPRSFPLLSVVEAAREVCDLIWVIDGSHPDLGSMPRMLKRFGTVVDVAGLPLEEAAEAIGLERPDGLLALADDYLAWGADVAEALALPFHTPAVAATLTDKHLQRSALAAAHLPVPRFWSLPADATLEDVDAVADQATFPVVLKPRRGEASRDTLPASSPAELRALYAEMTADRPRPFAVEEFIPDGPEGIAGEGFGGYVSVESISCGGTLSHVAVTGRMVPAHPFRETGFFIPSALDETTTRAVCEAAAAAVRAVGVTIGCTHTEVKLTPSGPVVIEVNGRIGGGVPEMLAAANGPDLLALSLRIALGETIVYDALPPTDRIGYLYYVQAPEALRTVTAVEGLDKVRAHPGVGEIILKNGPGHSVDWREGNHGHVFAVDGVCADHDALRAFSAFLDDTVRIEGQ